MSLRRIPAAGALVALGFLAACVERLPTITVRIAGEEFRLEVARTEAQQARGLMHRRSIGPRQGMLFVYQADQHLSFWMKNTTIPLTLAFLSRDGVILQIEELKPLSLRPVSSERAVRYAVELPLGALDRLGVKVGDRIELPAGFR